MAEDTNAAPAAGEQSQSPTSNTGAGEGTGPLSVREAARMLSQWRHQQAQAAPTAEPSNKPDASAPAAPPAQESADTADISPHDEQPDEAQEVEAAPDEPPIDPPAAWTSEEKQRFRTLPREMQDYLAQRESARDAKLLQSQREAKEQARHQQEKFQAEFLKLEQSRQQYEQALPSVVQALQQSLAGDFPDIKSYEDQERLAREDIVRFSQWQARQNSLAVIANEARAAQERQANDLQMRFATYAKEQDQAFIERNPEFADKDKAAALQRAAIETMKDIGFNEDELARHWTGQDALSLRDKRVQQLLADAVRYRQARAAVKKTEAKPQPPPVQRPGTAAAPRRGGETEIRNIEKQMQTARGNTAVKLAVRLQQLHRELGR